MILLVVLCWPCLIETAPPSPPLPPPPGSKNVIANDEMAFYQEADILPDKYRSTRIPLRDNQRLWDGGNLGYILDYDYETEGYVTDIIQAAITEINHVDCVYITPALNTTEDYVVVKLSDDYSSHLGRLATSTTDQTEDQYVTIDFTNIREEARQYFTKYTPESGFTTDTFHYDYTSIMHATNIYDPTININPSKPVIWRKDGGTELGQRYMLTDLDKQQLRLTYSCGMCSVPENSELVDVCVTVRYPGDCTKFIQCASLNAFVMECPAGLHFSESHRYCDYPNIANCTSL
ncbi:hypothetical protein Pmani_031549 [Petrolisthes manimaculis]|uniref:Chitin-binding type-2 domain-containing protein n=1 Tax=Petrolisthes manimaculis TaxID=1843537 RepID=A0AAE1NTJ5_9EUCA|nr:hypothetical protein Pmani_031549 [Petrolisthes manimaculis]